MFLRTISNQSKVVLHIFHVLAKFLELSETGDVKPKKMSSKMLLHKTPWNYQRRQQGFLSDEHFRYVPVGAALNSFCRTQTPQRAQVIPLVSSYRNLGLGANNSLFCWNSAKWLTSFEDFILKTIHIGPTWVAPIRLAIVGSFHVGLAKNFLAIDL
jgi:hypothetical protein